MLYLTYDEVAVGWWATVSTGGGGGGGGGDGGDGVDSSDPPRSSV